MIAIFIIWAAVALFAAVFLWLELRETQKGLSEQRELRDYWEDRARKTRDMVRDMIYLVRHGWRLDTSHYDEDEIAAGLVCMYAPDETRKRTVQDAMERQLLLERAIRMNVPLKLVDSAVAEVGT